MSRLRRVAIAFLLFCLCGSWSEAAYELGFHSPLDDTELSWTAQPCATGYQLLRSTLEDFSAPCTTFETPHVYQTDATEPLPGGLLYYLVRKLTPEPGSWGTQSDGSARAVSCLAPAGALVGSSGCHSGAGAGSALETPLTLDCIEYQHLGEGQLLLNHLNTAFNCCPEFVAGIDIDDHTIIVSEDEISGDCDCICLFDLSYEIVNLEPGVYEVTVIQEYLIEGDEPLDFTMDLLASPSGMHCVERNHYPW